MTDNEKWLAWRKTGIGGSDCSAILGHNPYMTHLDVWNNKVLDYDHPQSEFSQKNCERGKKVEKLVFERIREAHKDLVDYQTDDWAMETNAQITHCDYPFMIGTPDAMIIFKKSLCWLTEIKSVSPKTWEKYNRTPPQFWIDQVLWYKYIIESNGLSVISVSLDVIVTENDAEEEGEFFSIPVNDSFLAEPLKKCYQFWEEFVVPKTRPPDKLGATIFDDDTIINRLDKLDHLYKNIKQKREELIKSLKLQFVDDEFIVNRNGKLIYSNSSSEREVFDKETFQQDYPDLYDEYSSKKAIQTFRLHS